MESLVQIAGNGLDDKMKCWILLKLLEKIEEDEEIGSGPGDIFLDGNKNITVKLQNGTDGLFYQPPEVIRLLLNRQEIRRGKEQKWFVVGMLAYWLYCQADYYMHNEIFLLESLLRENHQPSVISREKLRDIPFPESVSLLTAWKEEERTQGVTKFVAYLDAHYPDLEQEESQGAAVPGNVVRRLYISKAFFTGRQADFGYDVPFLDLNHQDGEKAITVKTQYPSCMFRVVLGMERGRARDIGGFTIKKPSLAGLDEYTISVAYRARQNALYFKLIANGRELKTIRKQLGVQT